MVKKYRKILKERGWKGLVEEAGWKIAVLIFLFFFLKGLVWLAVFFGLFQALSSG